MFVLPKLIYPLTSLPNPNKEAIKRLEKLMYDFILEGKPKKTKTKCTSHRRSVLVADIEKNHFVTESKLDKTSPRKQKYFENTLFKSFCGNILIECNFSAADITKHFIKKPFLRDISLAWSKLNYKKIVYNHCNEII